MNDASLIGSLWNAGGDNSFRFVKAAANNAFSWVRARLVAGADEETVCIFDVPADEGCGNEILGAAGLTFGPVDEAVSFSGLLSSTTEVSVTPYENSELPSSVDLSGLPDGDYELCVTVEPPAASTPTSLRFDVAATQIFPGSTFEFLLNGLPVTEAPVVPNPPPPTCIPAIQSVEVSDPGILSAWNAAGANELRFVSSAPGTLVAWVRATVTANGQSVDACLFEFEGGDCSEGNICEAGFTDGPLDESVVLEGIGELSVSCKPFTKSGQDEILINIPCKNIVKTLAAGPTEVEIQLPDPTMFTVDILWEDRNPDRPVRVVDTMPQEFEVVSVTPTVGDAVFFNVGNGGNSADRIHWDIPVGTSSAVLSVAIETARLPGSSKRNPRFKPGDCGTFVVNEGATAFELDPTTGEIVQVEIPPPAPELLENGSFETGDFAGWIAKDMAAPFFPGQVVGSGVSTGPGFFVSEPTDGEFAAVSGFDGGGPDTIELGQDVDIPAGATSATLSFDWRAAWNFLFGSPGTVRTLAVVVEPAGGGAPLFSTTVLEANAAVEPVNPDTGPQSTSVDLTAFAGTSVRVKIVATIPDPFSGPGFLQIDNVSLQAIGSSEPTFEPVILAGPSNGISIEAVAGEVGCDD